MTAVAITSERLNPLSVATRVTRSNTSAGMDMAVFTPRFIWSHSLSRGSRDRGALTSYRTAGLPPGAGD